LSLIAGAFVMVPLCRRWIGGPLWIYATSALGLAILIVTELRQIVLASESAEEMEPVAWLTVGMQGTGAFLALAGFALWMRHIQRSRLELKAMATTDPLTHLSNRRHATTMFQHEAARARRYGVPLSVMAIDVDHLKPVNDQYGHLAGDALLKHLAQVLKLRLRSTDIIARFGGDEFLALLPETDAPSTLQLAVELRQVLYDHPARYGELDLPVQASFGVAEFPARTEGGQELSIEELIARADEALYAVKKQGGNGVADWATLQARQDPAAPLAPRRMAASAS
jgi:diguanylate cyclase (GGDEF)-like protein